MPMRGICGVILLLACIEVSAERPVRSLLEYRTENLILQQWDNSCAAAALATLLTYEWRRPVTERQVAHAQFDMKRYLAGIGIAGEGYGSLSLDDLRPFAPAIVPASLRGFDHFVIVREVGATHVAIGDPAFGNYRMTHSAFLRSWSGTAFRLQPLAPLMPGKEQ